MFQSDSVSSDNHTMKGFCFLLLLCLSFFGCSKPKPDESVVIQDDFKTHQWYYFSQNGFFKTDRPQKSEIASLKPWSETLRVSQANCGSEQNGCLLVNRLGALFFNPDGTPVFIQDFQLFSDNTASNLFFIDGEPYFTLTKSSFFNKNASLEHSDKTDFERPFLVRISRDDRSFFPVITYGDLKLSAGGEITGTFFDGATFISSVKTAAHGKTHFSYLKYSPKEKLSSLPPKTREGKLEISETDEDEYRAFSSPLDFSSAPKRLKSLLSSLPADFDFSVSLKDTSGTSPRLFSTKNDAEFLPQAYAIIGEEWICAVFSDGTTYFNGALKDREILNNGKTAAFRLPKLPENYVYTEFCIDGSTFACGWEEKDFYKTGRSGFLTVDLEVLLYEKN